MLLISMMPSSDADAACCHDAALDFAAAMMLIYAMLPRYAFDAFDALLCA